MEDKKTDTTNARRQSRRRAALDEIARAAGYPSWAQLETAALHGEIAITKRPPNNSE